MVSSEEIGNIIARLAIHDEAFLAGMLEAARQAGDGVLPGDVERLEAWVRVMRALRLLRAATGISSAGHN